MFSDQPKWSKNGCVSLANAPTPRKGALLWQLIPEAISHFHFLPFEMLRGLKAAPKKETRGTLLANRSRSFGSGPGPDLPPRKRPCWPRADHLTSSPKTPWEPQRKYTISKKDPRNGPKTAIGRSFHRPFASHWRVLAGISKETRKHNSGAKLLTGKDPYGCACPNCPCGF